MMVDSSKDFEAMKAGKLAIRPWLSCQYTENTLMDKPWLRTDTMNEAEVKNLSLFILRKEILLQKTLFC